MRRALVTFGFIFTTVFLASSTMTGTILWAAPMTVNESLALKAPELQTLSNGLTIAWYPNDSLPVVDLVLLVKSGYRDDPRGKSGTSELVAATLDKGAGGLSAQAISQAVERLGASRYAIADDDNFSAGMHGLAPDAPVLLGILSKMVVSPNFPESEVKREHSRLLERWSHLPDYGDALASLAFHRLIAAGTEYGRGNFLRIPEFAKVSRADLLVYHKTHFTPKNSILMVVGRVDRQKFADRIQQDFGSWQGEAPPREPVIFSDPAVKRSSPGEILLVERPGLTQAAIRMGFRGPLMKSPDRYSLAVLNALLGEYFHSRLNTVIRDQLGLTYGINSSFGFSLSLGTFAISSATRNETAGTLIKKTREILEDIKSGNISEEEVVMAKEYLIGGFPLSVATLNDVASRWLNGYVFDLGPEYLNGLVPRIAGVTREQVIAAAKKHLDLAHLTVVVAGDPAPILTSLKASGFGRVKRVKPKALME